MSDRDENWEHLLDAVHRRQEELGLGPTALAAKAGLAFQTVNDALTGTRRPQPRTRREIARALGWPPEVPERILAGEEPDAVLRELTLDHVLPHGEGGDLDNLVVLRAGPHSGESTAQLDGVARQQALAEERALAEMLEDYLLSRGYRLATRQDLGVDRRVDVAWQDTDGNYGFVEVKAGVPSGPALDEFADRVVGTVADIRAQAPGTTAVFVSYRWDDTLAARLERHHVIYATPDDNWARLEEQLGAERGRDLSQARTRQHPTGGR